MNDVVAYGMRFVGEADRQSVSHTIRALLATALALRDQANPEEPR